MLKRIKKKLNSNAEKAVPPGYFGCADELTKPCVSGWVSYADESLNPVMLKITKGDEVKFVIADRERKDVLQVGRVKTTCCGYQVSFSADNFEPAMVEVLSSMGKLSKDVPSYKNRKLFFIHIPKAAGSSVNDLMSAVIEGPYFTHIEGLRDRWGDIKEAKFLSGHIRYNDYVSSFSQHDYVVFAFLREPLSHLKSHMNWVRRLAEPELINKRDSHSDIVHKIADELAVLDFTGINSLASYVKQIKPIAYGLFDNCQVRFLSEVKANERVCQKHLEQAVRNLRHLHFVGISEHSKESQAQLLSLLGMEGKASEAKSNVNSYDYGLDITKGEVIDTLNPLVQFDIQLYAEAKKIFLAQAQRIDDCTNA